MKRFLLIGILVFANSSFAADTRVSPRHYSVSSSNIVSRSLFEGVDTLKILALRVEFQPDNDPNTTGDGRFDMTLSQEATIDPPPHDDTYFSDQLLALSNYYETVSNGRLQVEYDLYFAGLTLADTMGFYNPASSEDSTNWGLARLFFDTVTLADQASVPFSDYNCVMIFHAGVGKDLNLGFDTTPSDIPSAFMNLEDLRTHLAGNDPNYQGISVQDGAHFVKEGVILPETQNQDGVEFGLLGTMALMTGFQLGMPALWNTDDGNTGIGRWGLMDQGSGNFSGLIPAHPCAFNKVFMGWVDPQVIDIQSGQMHQVHAYAENQPQTIFKVPINEHEYFLIENRQYDVNGDTVATGTDGEGNPVRFLANGSIEVTQAGVIVGVDEYDFGLPGSGILIWHVDESVVARGLAGNRINADPVQKGVVLEEADGAYDIGQSYSMTHPGYAATTGVLHDAWFAGNEINLLVNDAETVAFTPSSFPSTASNAGGNTHIVIQDFTDRAPVMTFSVSNDWAMPMTPFTAPQAVGEVTAPPLFGDLEGSGFPMLVMGTEECVVLWSATSEMNFYNLLPCDAGVPLAVGDIDQDGRDEVVTVYENKLIAYDGSTNQGGATADTLFHMAVAAGENPVTDIMLMPDAPNGPVICLTSENRVLALNSLGEETWSRSLDFQPLSLTRFESEGEAAVLVSGEEIIALVENGDIVWNYSYPLGEAPVLASGWLEPDAIQFVSGVHEGISGIFQDDGLAPHGYFNEPMNSSSPAVADLDEDGLMEIVITGEGQVFVFNHNGTLVDQFPAPGYRRDITLSAPIIGDVDGDGHLDIIVTTSQGNVEAWSNSGVMVDGFPLTTGAAEPMPPLLYDGDNDGDIDLAAFTQQGKVYLWDLPGAYTAESVPWGSFRHDPAASGMNPQHLTPVAATGDWFPESLVYNYPNPTEGNFTTIRYRLEESADVEIKIYDATGELIDSFGGPGAAQTENEMLWDVSDIPSGAYFCRVTASSERGEKSVMCKIAVVK